MSICAYHDKSGDHSALYSHASTKSEKCTSVDSSHGIEKSKNLTLPRLEVNRDIQLPEVEYASGYGKETMLTSLASIERSKRHIQVALDSYESKLLKPLPPVEIIGDNFDWTKKHDLQ